MRRSLKRICTVLTLSFGVALAAPAASAYAINGVWCNDEGYLMISGYWDNGPGDFCYANAGETEIWISGVYFLHSGNNAGYVDVIHSDGVTRRHYFDKWQELDLAGDADYLHIN